MGGGMQHSIGVLVKGNDALTSSLHSASSALDAFGKSAEEAQSRVNGLQTPNMDTAGLKKSGKDLTALGATGMAVGGAIMAGMGVSVQSATAFGKEMATVATMVDTSKVNVDALGQQMMTLGAQYGALPTDTAKALYTTMSAGFADTTDATILMTGAMKLAKGGVAGLEPTVDGLTSIMNSYGMKASEVGTLSDQMFVATMAGKTTIEELAGSLGKVTPLASSMGVGVDELLGSVAALTLGGMGTAEAVTSLRGVMSSVMKPTKEASDMAKELGIGFDAATLKSMGLQNWLAMVAEKTGGSQEKMAVLFGQVEALSGVLALTGPQAGQFAGVMDQIGNSAGAADAAFQKVNASAAAGFDRAAAGAEALKITIGNQLLPTINAMSDSFSGIASGFQTFADAHPILARLAVVLPTVIAGVVGIGGALLVLVPIVISAMAAINLSTGGWILIIGGLITAITGLVMYFSTSSEEIGDSMSWLTDIWDGVKAAFMALVTPIAYGLGFLAGIFTMVWQKLADYTNQVWPMIKQVIMGVWNAIMYLLQPGLDALYNLMVGGWNAILALVNGTWEAIKLVVVTAWNIIYESLAMVWNLISGLFKTFLQLLTGDWSGAWETLKATALAVWENIKGIFGSIISYFTGMAQTFWDAGKGFVNAIWEGIKAAWGSLVDGVSGMLSDLRDLLPFSDAKEGPLSNLTGSGGAFVQTFANGISGAADYAVSALSSVLGTLREFLPFSDAKKGPLSELTKSGASLLPTFAEGIQNGGKSPANAMSEAMGAISMEPPAPSRYAGEDQAGSAGKTSVTFAAGSIVVNIAGDRPLSDLEDELAAIFGRLALRMGGSV